MIKYTISVWNRSDGPDYGFKEKIQVFDMAQAYGTFGKLVNRYNKELLAGTCHVELVANIDGDITC